MTTFSQSYEEQTRRLLAEAKSEHDQIVNQIEALQKRREALVAEAYAYELTLQGYLRRSGKQPEVTADASWVDALCDKTHKEKIVEFARHNGGVVKVGQVADFLYTNGLIKSKSRQNAYIVLQKIFAELLENGTLEKTGPAEYLLVGAQPRLPESPIPSFRNLVDDSNN